MNDYTNYHLSREDKVKGHGERLFYKQFKGIEGFKVAVNGIHERDVIIQQHTNPINERLDDKLMIFLKSEDSFIAWGDEILGYDEDYRYLVITEPHDNGVYMTCKIRKLPDKIGFEIEGKQLSYDCILNNSMLYNESSYVGDTQVFTEEDIRALIIRYDENTSKIKLFDYITVGNIYFKVTDIDKKAFMRQDEEFGVLQITLIETINCSIVVNFDNPVRGVMRSARLKEAVFNANARTLLCDPDSVTTGDYVTFETDRQRDNIRTHIVMNMIDTRVDYDSCFVLHCSKMCRWIDKDTKEIKEFPLRWQDNKTMLMETNTDQLDLPANVQQGQIQENEFTKKIRHGFRFISNGEVLEVVGLDKQVMNGIVGLRVKTGIETKYDNMELEIADYYKYFSKGDAEEPIEPDLTGYTLIIDGEDDMYTGLDDDYTVTVLAGGVPISGLATTWSIDNLDGSNKAYAEIASIDGYVCNVQANTKNVGKEFMLKVHLTNDVNISTQKKIRIRGF